MSQLELLDNVTHADLRVITDHSAAYGDDVHQVLLVPTEFSEAHKYYPILFQKDDNDNFQPTVILGLDKGENLFLNDGGWTVPYVPAILARGPFMIGMKDVQQDGLPAKEPMVLVDRAHARVSLTKGERVFKTHGGNSPYLDRVTGILRALHVGHEITKPMFEAFEKAGLLTPVNLEVQLDEATQYRLQDFYSISQEALANLDGATLESLNRQGFLSLAFYVVASTSNMKRIIELKNQKRAAL